MTYMHMQHTYTYNTLLKAQHILTVLVEWSHCVGAYATHEIPYHFPCTAVSMQAVRASYVM